MHHEIGRRIGQQGKAEGVRFGKAVVGKCLDAFDDIVLRRLVDICSVIPARRFVSIFSSVCPAV